MAHNFLVTSNDTQGVTFTCSLCSEVITFVHTDYGSPNPVPDGSGSWTVPEPVDGWAGSCVE